MNPTTTVVDRIPLAKATALILLEHATSGKPYPLRVAQNGEGSDLLDVSWDRIASLRLWADWFGAHQPTEIHNDEFRRAVVNARADWMGWRLMLTAGEFLPTVDDVDDETVALISEAADRVIALRGPDDLDLHAMPTGDQANHATARALTTGDPAIAREYYTKPPGVAVATFVEPDAGLRDAHGRAVDVTLTTDHTVPDGRAHVMDAEHAGIGYGNASAARCPKCENSDSGNCHTRTDGCDHPLVDDGDPTVAVPVLLDESDRVIEHDELPTVPAELVPLVVSRTAGSTVADIDAVLADAEAGR